MINFGQSSRMPGALFQLSRGAQTTLCIADNIRIIIFDPNPRNMRPKTKNQHDAEQNFINPLTSHDALPFVLVVQGLQEQLKRALAINLQLLNESIRRRDAGNSKSYNSSRTQDKKENEKGVRGSIQKDFLSESEKSANQQQKPQIKHQDDSDYFPLIPAREDIENNLNSTKKDTKNIVKTLIMAICKFITSNKAIVRRLFVDTMPEEDLPKFYQFINRVRMQANYLSDLRKIWINDKKQGKYPKFRHLFRILSFLFLRKYSLPHFFNSHRIKSRFIYMKCRTRLLEGISRPESLTNLKQY